MPTKISPVGSSASGGGSVGPTTPTDFTEGSVIFAGASTLSQNNASFFWDDTNTQLKLTAGGATKTPLKIILAGSQTADAWQVYASDGTTKVAGISAAGGFISYAQTLVINNNNGSASFGSTSISYNDFYTLTGSRRFVGANAVDGVSANQLGVVSGTQIGFFASASDPVSGSMDSAFARTAAGIIKVTNGSTGGGSLHFQEQTAPSAPAANNVYLYAQDDGAGKTQLMALFATGAAQQVAIEP